MKLLMVLELFKDPNMTKTIKISHIPSVHFAIQDENLTFPKSYYLFMKHIQSIVTYSPVIHYFCSNCQLYFGLTN